MEDLAWHPSDMGFHQPSASSWKRREKSRFSECGAGQFWTTHQRVVTSRGNLASIGWTHAGTRDAECDQGVEPQSPARQCILAVNVQCLPPDAARSPALIKASQSAKKYPTFEGCDAPRR